jgi:MYXO-CTERM domain-containing protein
MPHEPAGYTTSLRPFGELMVSRYGLISTMTDTNAANESVATACAQLEANEPILVQDLQKGMDPNGDVPDTPVPEYGCSNSVASGGAEPGAALFVVGVGLALVMWRRGDGSRKR